MNWIINIYCEAAAEEIKDILFDLDAAMNINNVEFQIESKEDK
jgi:hypothetical protein